MKLLPVPAGVRDITGLRFDRLVVLGIGYERQRFDRRGRRIGFHRKWLCKCDCGGTALSTSHCLAIKRSRSCGCYRSDKSATHRKSKSTEHVTWCSMKQRCYDKNARNYERYGARGITVCNRWRNNFDAFLADMGPRPSKKHSIERIDNLKGYSPENCRWATRVEQCNNRRSSAYWTAFGRTQTIAQWAREIGMDQVSLRSRVAVLKMSIEEALTRPKRKDSRSENNRRRREQQAMAGEAR